MDLKFTLLFALITMINTADAVPINNNVVKGLDTAKCLEMNKEECQKRFEEDARINLKYLLSMYKNWTVDHINQDEEFIEKALVYLKDFYKEKFQKIHASHSSQKQTQSSNNPLGGESNDFISSISNVAKGMLTSAMKNMFGGGSGSESKEPESSGLGLNLMDLVSGILTG